jgi:hypothetical protein
VREDPGAAVRSGDVGLHLPGADQGKVLFSRNSKIW